jgi:hypothetical protein
MSVFVTSAPVPTLAAVFALDVTFFTPVGRPAHSGHLIPTAVCTMQSVQIGRKQLEQLTSVSRPGCR